MGSGFAGARPRNENTVNMAQWFYTIGYEKARRRM